MKIDTIEKLDELFDTYDTIQQKGEDIARVLVELEGDKHHDWTVEHMYIEDGSMYAWLEDYNWCDNYTNRKDLYIPNRYFFDDNWIAEEKEKIQTKKEKVRIEAEMKEKRKNDIAAEQKYKKYLELKAEYE